MKNKILNLTKSAILLVLCLLVGALAFEGVCSLTNRKEPAKEFSTTVFTKNGGGMTICLWTRNTKFVLFTQRAALVIKRKIMKKCEYRVRPIFIKKDEDMASKLTEVLNEESGCGWQLVQWDLVPTTTMLMTSLTTPLFGTIMIMATLKKEKEYED